LPERVHPDPDIEQLCDQIIASQREIDIMKHMLDER
jgi:uncharacterized protein (DUF305 family)